MDNKKFYILMFAVMVLTLGWYAFIQKVIRPKHPEWDWTNQQAQNASQTQPSGAGTESISQGPGAENAPATSTSPSTRPSVGLSASGVVEPGQVSQIGSTAANDPNYTLGLQVNPLGASLDSVTINRAKSIDAKSLYVFQNEYSEHTDWRSLTCRSLSIDGAKVDLWHVAWKLQASTAASATYGVDILSAAGVPVARVEKSYQLSTVAQDAKKDNGTVGYEVDVNYRVANLSKESHSYQLAFAGPTMPPREIERSDDRVIVSGYDRGEQLVDTTKDLMSTYHVGAVWKDMSKSSAGYPILWAGEASVYFSGIVRPDSKGQVTSVTAQTLNPRAEPDQQQLILAFATADLKVEQGAAVDVPLKVFFGPMDRTMLEGDYYRSYPRFYDKLLATSSGICGMCAFPWLIDFLVNVLRAFHFIFRDWGVSIIILVIVVRGLLHPIAKKSQVSMLQMQKLAPEMERLKKKFGDDKEGFAKAQMELYKGMGATPVLGCLPMLLQMPIWFALYSALQSEYNLRQAPFLWGYTWIHDLARPDRLIAFDNHAFVIPIIHVPVSALNILPLLMAVVMFIQQKVTPQPPATTPEQASQRKMMQWMSLIFAVFFYPAPSGLNLYILTSTTLGIIESKIIRDHVKKAQEEEKTRVIVDAGKQTRMGKQRQQDNASQPKKPGLWSRLQEKLEELRQQAERERKRRK